MCDILLSVEKPEPANALHSKPYSYQEWMVDMF